MDTAGASDVTGMTGRIAIRSERLGFWEPWRQKGSVSVKVNTNNLCNSSDKPELLLTSTVRHNLTYTDRCFLWFLRLLKKTLIKYGWYGMEGKQAINIEVKKNNRNCVIRKC